MDNKSFIEELSARIDVSIATVNTLTEAMSSEFVKAASKQQGIVIPGFGIFESRLRQERIAVHPANGHRLLVPPRIFLTFRQSPVLKQKINNGK